MIEFLMKPMRIAGIATLALLVAAPAMASDDNDDDLGAFIREGNCDQPGSVVEDIGDLDPEDDIWTVIGQDESQPSTVYGEDEDISQSIEDLTSGDYIVTIHATDDEDAAVIACGNITGDADSDGTLMIELEEVDDSGYIGRVFFEPSDDHHNHRHHNQTQVTTGVWQGTRATPEASPSA